MAFSLANPGVRYLERADLIPLRPDQELDVLFFIQGRDSLSTAHSNVITYSNYSSFLEAIDVDDTVGAYEKQAVYTAFLHHTPIRVCWLQAHADLTTALNALEYSALVVYPHASTLDLAARNAAYTLLLNWCEDNAGELFTEPLVTVDAKGYVTATPKTVAAVLTDLAGITIESQNGHWRYYAPSLPSTFTDADGTWYLSAAAIGASVLANRVLVEGIRQPGAGRKCAITGVSPSVDTWFTDDEADTLNESKVNPITQRFGVWQPYAANTQAIQEAFVASTARQIFNTIRKGAEQLGQQLLFESIDGKGELYQAAQQVFNQFMYRLWSDGALFGKSPDTAYLVVCDDTNNPPEDLEANILNVDLYAIPSPNSQQVLITTVRKAIGSIQP